MARETEINGTLTEFEASEIKSSAPMIELIRPETEIEAMDGRRIATETDFIATVR
jgi:hypothetical protein